MKTLLMFFVVLFVLQTSFAQDMTCDITSVSVTTHESQSSDSLSYDVFTQSDRIFEKKEVIESELDYTHNLFAAFQADSLLFAFGVININGNVCIVQHTNYGTHINTGSKTYYPSSVLSPEEKLLFRQILHDIENKNNVNVIFKR